LHFLKRRNFPAFCLGVRGSICHRLAADVLLELLIGDKFARKFAGRTEA